VTYQPWRDPHAVNLLGVAPVPLYDGGYYLFSTPHTSGDRVGVVLAVRERNRLLYRVKYDLTANGRTPTPWRMALGEVLALKQT
jgi:hypothetical protein